MSSTNVVTLKQRTIVGSSADGIVSFIGISYAQSPTGSRRLRLSLSIINTFGPLTATAPPSAALGISALPAGFI
jgi:carboxylesterase type B